MAKFSCREDVIERYWPDYLSHCMLSLDSEYRAFNEYPTVDGFWTWYITKGPMGTKHINRFYNEDRVEYV